MTIGSAHDMDIVYDNKIYRQGDSTRLSQAYLNNIKRLDEADRLVMVARVDRDNGAETAKPEEEGESEELSAEEIARMEAEDAAADEGAGDPDPDDAE